MIIDKTYDKDIDTEIDHIFNSNYAKISQSFTKISFYKNIKEILNKYYYNPWVTQKQLFQLLKLEDINSLKILNSYIQQSDFFQNLITKLSPANKYWNTILPFMSRCEDVIKNRFKMPLRIAIFPGLSCMFYCGFCGRNQSAKYPSSSVDQSVRNFKSLFSSIDRSTKISISGGLEPFTNFKIGEIISSAHDNGFKLPLITNGYNLTKNFLARNPAIWKLDSIRFSLYGYDDESYYYITRQKKSYEMVRKNLIELAKQRNIHNKNLKIGLNFIILNENMYHLSKVINFIKNINDEIDNGPGINFLTLRDDYQSVTTHSKELDLERKYRLENKIKLDDRKKLINIIKNFDELKSEKCEKLHVDYGYSLEFLKRGYLDSGLIKVKGSEIRNFGFTQLSVAIDTFGDVFLFREAGFLNRHGNEKVIIGRVSDENSFENVIKNFLKKNNSICFENEDSRFLDSFDHVLNALVNQFEEDYDFGITLDDRPIRYKIFSDSKNKGNNWYSDDI